MTQEEYQKLLEETKEVTKSEVRKIGGYDEEDANYSCIHTIVFNNGEVYKWKESNVFDMGTGFHPEFPIVEGRKFSGLLITRDNENTVQIFDFKNPDDKYKSWYTVRELTGYELKSYLIAKYNSEFGDMIRM